MTYSSARLLTLANSAYRANFASIRDAFLDIRGVLGSISATTLAYLASVTAGTVAASKAVVVDANKDVSAFRDITARSLLGASAAAGVAITVTGGASSTSTNAGGAATLAGAAGTATTGTTAGGVGGAASLTSGAGGAKSDTGAAAGGAAGTATLAGGVGGATANSSTSAGGAGGAAAVTGGAGGAASAGTGNGGAGGSVVLTPGAGGASAGGTAGLTGAIRAMGTIVRSQGTPGAYTVTAGLTAAHLYGGLITTTGVTGPSVHQLPTGTQIDAVVPGAATGDSFDFHIINTGTGASDDATITVNTDVTIVGNPTVGSLTDGTIISGSGHFRARRSAANTWIVYRLS